MKEVVDYLHTLCDRFVYRFIRYNAEEQRLEASLDGVTYIVIWEEVRPEKKVCRWQWANPRTRKIHSMFMTEQEATGWIPDAIKLAWTEMEFDE